MTHPFYIYVYITQSHTQTQRIQTYKVQTTCPHNTHYDIHTTHTIYAHNTDNIYTHTTHTHTHIHTIHTCTHTDYEHTTPMHTSHTHYKILLAHVS